MQHVQGNDATTKSRSSMKLAFGIAFALLGVAPSTALAEKTTIYFVRHAEQMTTQTVVGEATSPYDAEWTGDEVQVTPVDLGDMEEEPTAGGRNLDEVCGVAKCAEDLTDLGLLRANLLGEYFASLGVAAPGGLDAAYSSHLYRARQTADPVAKLAGLDTVIQLPEGGTELNPEGPSGSVCPTVEALRGHAAGSTLLVSAHTSTLYPIMGGGRDGECDGLGVDTSDDDTFPRDERGKLPKSEFGNIWVVEIDEEGSASLKEHHVLNFALAATINPSPTATETEQGPTSRALSQNTDYSRQIALGLGGVVLAVGGFVLAY